MSRLAYLVAVSLTALVPLWVGAVVIDYPVSQAEERHEECAPEEPLVEGKTHVFRPQNGERYISKYERKNKGKPRIQS